MIDAPVLNFMDRQVHRLHHWGITRKIQMRVAFLATAFVGSAFAVIRGGAPWMAAIFGAVILFALAMDEWRLRAYGTRIFNLGQMGARLSVFMTGTRIGCSVFILGSVLTHFPWGLDSLIIVTTLYMQPTFQPEDPPKRKLSEKLAELLDSAKTPVTPPAH